MERGGILKHPTSHVPSSQTWSKTAKRRTKEDAKKCIAGSEELRRAATCLARSRRRKPGPEATLGRTCLSIFVVVCFCFCFAVCFLIVLMFVLLFWRFCCCFCCYSNVCFVVISVFVLLLFWRFCCCFCCYSNVCFVVVISVFVFILFYVV